MIDLTQRQLLDIIVRSLNETGKRMAAKYRGAAADRPAAQAGERDAGGRKRGKAAGSQSARRRGRV
jgi:hypothetical protein